MRILALADHSLYGKSVVDHAAWIASNRGDATIQLLNVVSPNELIAERMPVHPGGALAVASQLSTTDEVEDLRRRGAAMLSETKATLEDKGLYGTTARLEEGIVAEIAIEGSQSADLMVIGKRGEHADLSRLPLGSNVERIVRGSTVPVLVVSRMLRPIQRALLPFDLDDQCQAAINWLVDTKMLASMPIALVHAGAENAEVAEGMADAALRLRSAGYTVSTSIVEGDPARVIAEMVVADSTDIVAMGAFGGSRLKSFFIGSLTSFVLRACQTPVLLVGKQSH